MNGGPCPATTPAEGSRNIFRAMEIGDLERIAVVEQAIQPFPWLGNKMRNCLEAGYECWVCEDEEGEIVAYSVMAGTFDECSLLNLGVALHHQGKGYGRRLLAFMLERARSQGRRHCFLEVRESNRPAIRLYESRGFYLVGRRKDYYPAVDGREDALVYRLDM